MPRASFAHREVSPDPQGQGRPSSIAMRRLRFKFEREGPEGQCRQNLADHRLSAGFLVSLWTADRVAYPASVPLPAAPATESPCRKTFQIVGSEQACDVKLYTATAIEEAAVGKPEEPYIRIIVETYRDGGSGLH